MNDTALYVAFSAIAAAIICLAWPVLRWVIFGPALLIASAGEFIGGLIDELTPPTPFDFLSHGESIGIPWGENSQAWVDTQAQEALIGAYREAYPDGYYPE